MLCFCFIDTGWKFKEGGGANSDLVDPKCYGQLTKEKMQISSGDRGRFKYTRNLKITNYIKQAFFTVGLTKTKLQITPSAGEDVGKQAITDCGWSTACWGWLGGLHLALGSKF